MAFPTTITTGGGVQVGGGIPYLSSAGNVYVIVRDSVTTSKLRAFKATDPATSFTNVGTDPQVTSTNTVQCISTYKVSDILHIVTADASGASTVDIRYHKFDMSTDSWSLTNEAIVTGIATAVTAAADNRAFISLRSNGDVIVLYNGVKVLNMGTDRARVYYARKVSGTWTTNVIVDNGGATSWYAGTNIIGSGDRHHFYFQDNGVADGYQRCLRSANTLEVFPTAFDTLTSADNFALQQNGISYDSSGTQKVRLPYATNVASQADSVKCDSADTPTMSIDVDITGATTVDIATTAYKLAYSANGTTLWHTFMEATTSDIFTQSNANDGGWSTPASFYVGSVDRIYTNIYTRNGDIVLAMVFSETNPKYHEKVLLAGDTSLPCCDFEMDFGGPRRRH